MTSLPYLCIHGGRSQGRCFYRAWAKTWCLLFGGDCLKSALFTVYFTVYVQWGEVWVKILMTDCMKTPGKYKYEVLFIYYHLFATFVATLKPLNSGPLNKCQP